MTMLWTLNNASSVVTDDAEYKVGKDGSVELPADLAESLRTTHLNGSKVWEDFNERHARLASEDAARRRDPATLLAAVEGLEQTVAGAAAKPARVRKAPAKKTPAKKAAAARKAPAKKPAPKPLASTAPAPVKGAPAGK